MPQLPSSPEAEALPVMSSKAGTQSAAKGKKAASKKPSLPETARDLKTPEVMQQEAADKKKAAAAGKPGKAKAKAKEGAGAVAKPGGLSRPQMRILVCLSKSKKPLSRAEIAKAAPVDNAYCTSYIGSQNPEIRAKNDVDVGKSLITLKLVSAGTVDVEGRATVVYSITDAGQKLVAAHLFSLSAPAKKNPK